LTDDSHTDEESALVAMDILQGCESLDQVVRMPRRGEAIEWALGEARPGDVVVIAGGRNACFPGMNSRVEQIDDRDVIYNWVAAQRPVHQGRTSGAKRAQKK
jgi:UDP-N-acetylmuramoyl-L-alanyl-D-glutamate--2,6-diaminopimelate ligase